MVTWGRVTRSDDRWIPQPKVLEGTLGETATVEKSEAEIEKVTGGCEGARMVERTVSRERGKPRLRLCVEGGS